MPQAPPVQRANTMPTASLREAPEPHAPGSRSSRPRKWRQACAPCTERELIQCDAARRREAGGVVQAGPRLGAGPPVRPNEPALMSRRLRLRHTPDPTLLQNLLKKLSVPGRNHRSSRPIPSQSARRLLRGRTATSPNRFVAGHFLPVLGLFRDRRRTHDRRRSAGVSRDDVFAAGSYCWYFEVRSPGAGTPARRGALFARRFGDRRPAIRTRSGAEGPEAHAPTALPSRAAPDAGCDDRLHRSPSPPA